MVKICERKTHSEVEDVIDAIMNGLQSGAESFKIGKHNWKDETIQNDVKLIVNSSPIKLDEFTVCGLKWKKEPLTNVAKYIGGEHSTIEVLFSHKSWGTVKYNIVVERQQNGIFLANNNGSGTVHAEASEFELNGMNLEKFLIICNQHNMKEYKFHKNDCHECNME